jgi:hypothetical protein
MNLIKNMAITESPTRAKFYIYRNLHTGDFSIRHNGRVIEHAKNIIALDCQFKVNEKGRLRVIKEKQKNVHAFVVCDAYLSGNDNPDLKNVFHDLENKLEHITYNPYLNNSFIMYGETIEKANTVFLSHGKCIWRLTENV